MVTHEMFEKLKSAEVGQVKVQVKLTLTYAFS